MSRYTDPLSSVKIASPCSADWNDMYGNERRRFCGQCKLNVYNLSDMSRDEAETLIMNAEGRLCVRFYRRSDGTVITRDCPVGWAKVKYRARAVAIAACSLFVTMFTGVISVSFFSKRTDPVVMGGVVPIQSQTQKQMPRLGVIGSTMSKMKEPQP